MKKLNLSFYQQTDVVSVARQLIGKILVSQFEGVRTSGRIVETEAYNGIADMASHAFGGRRTPRTEIMFNNGGCAYVYLCYGIHHLFNVVTNKKDTPHAVLIRALDPLEGLDIMLERRKKEKIDYTLTRGPGSLAAAMGINTKHSGMSLAGPDIFIAEDDFFIKESEINCGPRIGVEYAGEDTLLPYRFFIASNPFVSRMPSAKKKIRILDS